MSDTYNRLFDATNGIFSSLPRLLAVVAAAALFVGLAATIVKYLNGGYGEDGLTEMMRDAFKKCVLMFVVGALAAFGIAFAMGFVQSTSWYSGAASNASDTSSQSWTVWWSESGSQDTLRKEG